LLIAKIYKGCIDKWSVQVLHVSTFAKYISSLKLGNQIKKNQLLESGWKPSLKASSSQQKVSLRFINIGLITLSIELLNKKTFLKLPDTLNLNTNIIKILHQPTNFFFLICCYQASVFIIYLHYVKHFFFAFELGTNRLKIILQTSEASAYWKKLKKQQQIMLISIHTRRPLNTEPSQHSTRISMSIFVNICFKQFSKKI